MTKNSHFNFRLISKITAAIGLVLGFSVALSKPQFSFVDLISTIFSIFIVFFPVVTIFYEFIIYEKNKKVIEINKAKKRENLKLELIDNIIEEHKRALLVRYSQLLQCDPYGNVDISGFEKEKKYFYKNVFLTSLLNFNIDLKGDDINYEEFSKYFDDIFVKLKESDLGQMHYQGHTSENLSPIDFERKCLNILEGIGWTGRLTKGSGDNGIDIIAEKNSLKAVFQCKLYNSPVGIKAVQEIFAGKRYERADIAAVVTNLRYTDSAIKMAKICNVMLLHIYDVNNFDDLVIDYM